MVETSIQLSSNVMKMGEVETSIKTVALTGARNAKADLSCSVVLSMMSTISKMANENPSATMISDLCSSILEANIICGGDAKNALQNTMNVFVTARLMVNKTLNVIQENLLSKFNLQILKNQLFSQWLLDPNHL